MRTACWTRSANSRSGCSVRCGDASTRSAGIWTGWTGACGARRPSNRLRQQQQRLDGLDLRLTRSIRAALDERNRALEARSRHLQALSPLRGIELAQRRLTGLPERLLQAWRLQQRRRSERLGAVGRQLHAVSPLATLQRGYAVLRRQDDGAVVTGTGQLSPGDRIDALLADGRAELQVERIEPADR